MSKRVTAKDDEDSTARRRYGVPEAAALLGMTKPTLYRRIRCGVIELPRLDGRLVVPASRLESLRQVPGLTVRPYRRRIIEGHEGADTRSD